VTTDFITYDKLGKGNLYQSFLDTLKTSHDIRVRVYSMNVSETNRRDISAYITSGQVDLDMSRDPDRWFQFTILDPHYRIAFVDPSSPKTGNLWAGSVVQCWYDVYVESADTWVETPVFTGPVQTLARNGWEVNVQCVGKEAFLLPPDAYDGVFSSAEVRALSSNRKDALQALLDSVGEPQPLLFHGENSNLPRSFHPINSFHGGGDSYLKLIQDIIGAQNQFFYDGGGRPTVRKRQHDGVHNLGGTELSAAAESFDMSKVRNRAQAKIQRQPTHKGGQQPPPVTVTEVLLPHQTMSAQNLGRSGTPRFLDEKATATYKKTADAEDGAIRLLKQGTTEDVTLDILPVPFLQPLDRVSIERPLPEGSNSDSQVLHLRVRSFSFPIHVGDGMSLGYTRTVLDPKHAKARFHKAKVKHGKQKKKHG